MLPVSASTTSWRSAQFSPIARLSSRFPRTSSSGLSHAPVTAAGVGGRQSKSFHRGEVSRSNARRQHAGGPPFKHVRTRLLFRCLPPAFPHSPPCRARSILDPPSSVLSPRRPAVPRIDAPVPASPRGSHHRPITSQPAWAGQEKKASGQPAATAQPHPARCRSWKPHCQPHSALLHSTPRTTPTP